MSTRAPASRAWEHKTVDVSAMNRAQLKDALDKEGADGWELAGVDSIVTGGLTTERTAIFKRQKFAVGVVNSTNAFGGGAGMPPGLGAAASGGGGNPFNPAATLPTPGGTKSEYSPSTITPLPSGSSGGFDPTPIRPSTGAPSAPKLSLHTIPLQAATATNAATVLKELLAIGEFPGVSAIISDTDTNSLIVKASDAGLKAISDRAKKLDESAAAKRKEDEVINKRKP